MDKQAIIPKPAKVIGYNGKFTLRPDTVIVSDRHTEKAALLCKKWLQPATGFDLPIVEHTEADTSSIRLKIAQIDLAPNEGYSLSVNPDSITLEASTNIGLFYALQSLRQLFPASIFSPTTINDVVWEIPCMKIEDGPRFAWRGSMLDVCRHFMPADYIYKYLDLLALHKMNTFHWHLSDDQGWRIEIKKYPQLTEIGGWRTETMIGHYSKNVEQPRFDGIRHGGYYTQDEVKGIVQYAQGLGITVVPEIEMPGHAQAAIAAYPRLGNTGKQLEVSKGWGIHHHVFNVNETTFEFLQDVLNEVLDLFPSQFIHIGGDEVPKKEWRESQQAQKRMLSLGLNDEDELQSYFIKRMDTFLTQHGRRLIGWDEILEGGLAPNATVMSWRGEAGGISAVKAGHDVVMAPNTYTYFDYYQSENKADEPLAIGGFLPLETVYGYEPIPDSITEEEGQHILGTQCQLWTEYISNPQRLEYMAFPRLCALAEVAWSPRERKDFEEFKDRLSKHQDRLDYLQVNYRRLS